MDRKSKLLKEKWREGEYTENINDISDVSDIMDIDLSNNSNDDIYNYLQIEKISGKDTIIKCDKKVGGVVTIPDNIFAISPNAFQGCDKITAIILPQNIGYIGYAAFNNCSSLKTIVIPNIYFEIGRYAFRRTRIAGLDDIYYLGDRESYRKYPISRALPDYGITESQIWFTEGRTKFDDYKKALDWFFAQPDEVQDNPDVMDTLISKFGLTWDEADAIYDLVNDSLYSYDDMLNIWYDWERRYDEAMKNLRELKKQSFTINESLTEAAQDQQLVSNGIYSVLNDKWIKEPVQGDIPDIDMDAFKKEFDVWEERYQELLNSIKEVDIGEEKKK